MASLSPPGGSPIEIDARHRGLGAFEDDVFGLLHVETGVAKLLEDMREHARLVAVTHDEHVRGRRCFARFTTFGTRPVSINGRDNPDRLGGDGFLRLIGRCADVMRSDDTGQR